MDGRVIARQIMIDWDVLTKLEKGEFKVEFDKFLEDFSQEVINRFSNKKQ